MLDILYYSRFCSYSNSVVQYLVKNGMSEKMNFICVDKRKRDDKNNNWFIELDDGKKVMMPPNVHSVPSLLMTRENYKVVVGEKEIFDYLEKIFGKQKIDATNNLSYYKTGGGASSGIALQSGNGEPLGVSLQTSNGGMNIASEQFTSYTMSVDELSAKGVGRQIHNYYPATHDMDNIMTPVDNYTSNKLPSNITIDVLEQKRHNDIPTETEPNFSI